MIAAMDARKIRDGGIGTYIRNLLARLPDRAPDRRFVALLDPGDAGAAPGCEELYVRAGKYSLAEHWVVARAARLTGASLLHAPHYTLPLAWNGPAVVTIHDLIHLRYPRFHPPGAALYARVVAGLAARRARIVLTDSEDARRDVIERLGANPDRVRAVPLGVSESLRRRPADEVLRFLAARGLPSGYVLYVGARKPHKNLPLLFEALGRMPSSSRPPLVLSGRAWRDDAPLAAAARRAGVAGGIHFAGDLADDGELACLYSGAALYAHPSLVEGFGLPPLEAMACGVPVVSSTGGSLAEILEGAALLLAPDDPARWAAALAEALGDAGRRMELTRRGYELAARFTWERTVDLTLAAYDDALA